MTRSVERFNNNVRNERNEMDEIIDTRSLRFVLKLLRFSVSGEYEARARDLRSLRSSFARRLTASRGLTVREL